MTTESPIAEPAMELVHFGADGLVPAVLQDAASRRVLMIGFMNAEALGATRRTGLVHFWSRSRGRLWQKGETSGNVSRVVELRINCEQNSLLLLVEQVSAICHDGYPTCFYRRVDEAGDLHVMEPRIFDPADVYGATSVLEQRASLADTINRWFGAYEYLRDHDLSADSSTSARLRSGEDLRGRVADELGELAGVLDGSHGHGEFADDIALEVGQVLYWTTLVAVGGGISLNALDLVAVIQTPVTASRAGLPGERWILHALSLAWPAAAQTDLASLIQTTAATLARVCSLTSVDIAHLIQDDLASLEKRPYLAGYFES